MIAAAVLVLLTILYRVVLGIGGSGNFEWLHNFSPMAAIALCGAIYLPRRFALSGPLLALLISDVILNAHYIHAGLYQGSIFSLEMLPRYLALGMTAGFGWLLRDNPRIGSVLGASLGASVLFFIISNTGSWFAEPAYANNAAGWVQANTSGLPGYPSVLVFFRNTVLSDLLFTGLFLVCIARQRDQAGVPQPAARHELAQW
jgi:hypothetical protein